MSQGVLGRQVKHKAAYTMGASTSDVDWVVMYMHVHTLIAPWSPFCSALTCVSIYRLLSMYNPPLHANVLQSRAQNAW